VEVLTSKDLIDRVWLSPRPCHSAACPASVCMRRLLVLWRCIDRICFAVLLNLTKPLHQVVAGALLWHAPPSAHLAQRAVLLTGL
jgi:hypothetical protein